MKNKEEARSCIVGGQFEKAKDILACHTRENPTDAEGWFLLGSVYGSIGTLRQAIMSFQAAINLKPDYSEAYYNLGLAFSHIGELDAAKSNYRMSLNLNPGNVDAYNNLGVLLRATGDLKDAMEMFNTALALDPRHVPTRCNRSLLLLLLGDYELGWREFEWRWARPQHEPMLAVAPEWKGEDIEKKTILIYGEQGFGDTIQFIRYARLIKQAGAFVVCACRPELVRLLQQSNDLDLVVTKGDGLPPVDTIAPLLRLPRIFNTTLETIPSEIPYLKPPRYCKENRFISLIDSPIDKKRVGLVWSGNPIHVNDHNRSCPSHYMRQLSDVENIQLYSLQKGDCATEIANIGGNIIDIGQVCEDFADTAYVISELDLVITVDTSVAHLAGALGKPVWLMLPFDPDWRWLLSRVDSPWYPSMRIFRQSEIGCWSGVICKIKEALAGV